MCIIALTYTKIIFHPSSEELPNLPQDDPDVVFVDEWQIPCAQHSKWRPRSPIPRDAEIICISDADSETGEKPVKRFVGYYDIMLSSKYRCTCMLISTFDQLFLCVPFIYPLISIFSFLVPEDHLQL